MVTVQLTSNFVLHMLGCPIFHMLLSYVHGVITMHEIRVSYITYCMGVVGYAI